MYESGAKENRGAHIFFCFQLKPTMTRRQTAREQVQKDKTNDDDKKTNKTTKKEDQNRWDSTQVKPLNTRTIQHC